MVDIQKRFRNGVVAFLLILGVCTVRVWAGDAVLIRKSGDVEIRAKGKKVFKRAEAGAELFFGDTVQTLKGARAQVLFANGNAVLLKEMTSARLNGSAARVTVHIPAGEFLIGLKQKLSRDQFFRVRTPAAVAAVRGTLFWGQSDDDLNATYACFQHEIEIAARGQKVVLKPGEKSFIPYGKAPQKAEPSNVPVDFIDTFSVDGSVEGLKEMAEQK